MVNNGPRAQEDRSVRSDNILMNTHIKLGFTKSRAVFGAGFDKLGHPCGGGVGNGGYAKRLVTVNLDLYVFSGEDIGPCCCDFSDVIRSRC